MKRKRQNCNSDDTFHATYQKTSDRQIATRARTRYREEQRAKRNWLDLLPPDLCKQIALHVQGIPENLLRCLSAGEYNVLPKISVMNLADISEQQREAVAEALSYKFDLVEHEILFPQAKWARTMHGLARRVDFGTERADNFLYLLNSNSLYSATLSNRAHLLRAVSNASQIRELFIFLMSNSYMTHLFRTLRKTNVTKLRLLCGSGRFGWRGQCLGALYPTKQSCKELVAACSKVTDLQISCCCFHCQSERFEGFISAFTSLKSLGFNVVLREDIIPHLRTIESVLCQWRTNECIGVSFLDHVKFATKIGSAVTSIEPFQYQPTFYAYPPKHRFNSAQAKLLSNCPRLRRLAMRLEPGAERSLPHLPNLESLDLYWTPTNYDILRRQEGIKEIYHVPAADFYSGLLEHSRHIKSLRLFKVRIAMSQMKALLKAFGRELRVFGTSIIDQDENPWERVLLVFNAIRAYNPELKRLDFCHTSRTRRSTLKIEGRRKWKARITCGVEVLHRCIPTLDVTRLYICLRRALGERFAVGYAAGYACCSGCMGASDSGISVGDSDSD